MAKRINLDHAATTSILPQAREAMAAAMDSWANPSSPHADGRRARALLEQAREDVGAALGWTGEVIFTSTATEAAALAFRRCHHHAPRPAMSTVEHDAVRSQVPEGEGFNLSVGADGLVDPEGLATWLRIAPGGLVAIQQCNSETGVLQPIAQISEVVDLAGSYMLVDCAQSAGKYPLPPADLIIVSSSKVGGPPGVAALLVRDLKLLVPAGGQERGYRRGTENLPAIAGFAAALSAKAWDMIAMAELRTALEERLWRHGVTTICGGTPRSAAIGAYSMPGLSAMAQLVRFDSMGFSVSAGSACSSGTTKASHVMDALGLEPEVAANTIRVSFGAHTTMDEVMAFADAWVMLAEESAARAA